MTVAAPATPVLLPASVAGEVAAAVGAALDNVGRHAGDGARAWILLEELDDEVTVSIRDDGAGIPDGRLAEAERDGRLGVAQSIRGRIRELGGAVSVTSGAGNGTEVELTVPR
ncbi:ATP-binding protein [Dactylosporangium sp. NPDC000244]|uniref:ATP-binding protein n=1 Tax=Dactylosporangium sp. NPDC000244 TaxID=3154365 RepID=UPI0033274938